MCPPGPARTPTLPTLQRLKSPVYQPHFLGHVLQKLTQFIDSSAKPGSSLSQKPSVAAASKSPAGRGSRVPRRVGAQPTRLEALDDSLGPLGPLGDSSPAFSRSEQPPSPPLKEQQQPQQQSLPVRSVQHGAQHTQSSMSRSMMDSIDLGDDSESTTSRARYPPPVQPPPAGLENPRRQTQPSVSIEQAAKPNFEITVGDPHKVGDLTSSHIVYQVRTKVGYSCLRALPLSNIIVDSLTFESTDIIKSVQTI